jgi:deazaflavin-dependent oxidoreductase (nitroreductase family)
LPLEHDLDSRPFCYLTTRGRNSGRPHRIEIWFAARDDVLFLLSGGGDRSDWVRNLLVEPLVTVEIGSHRIEGTARVLTSGSVDDRVARDSVFDKYQPRYGGDLTSWRESSLAIAIELALT